MKKSDTKRKLDKDQLDSMTRDEIENYRMYFITNNNWSDKSISELNRKYLDELSIYELVRFKNDRYAMYDRWCKLSKENKKKGIKDDLLDFNVDMLERENGYDLIYYLGLTSDLKKLGEFEYIKDIDIDIPTEYKEMFKFGN